MQATPAAPAKPADSPEAKAVPGRVVDVANFRLLPLSGAPKVSAKVDPTLGKTGVDEDLDVAGDSRLALAEHLGDLAHRELHRPEQHQDAQPGRIGQGGENLGRIGHICGYKDIFISVKRGFDY